MTDRQLSLLAMIARQTCAERLFGADRRVAWKLVDAGFVTHSVHGHLDYFEINTMGKVYLESLRSPGATKAAVLADPVARAAYVQNRLDRGTR